MKTIEGLKHVFTPPAEHGQIVSAIAYRDYLYVVCEYAMYRIKHDDDGEPVVELEMLGAAPEER